VGLVTSLDDKINKLNKGLVNFLYSKINKLNEGFVECIRNYSEMGIELEVIENGNISPNNSNSHWMPPQSH
jgi:hypothetical protein